MQVEAIEGFRALDFKDAVQARVQSELSGLSADERLRQIHERAADGPFAEAVRRWTSQRPHYTDPLALVGAAADRG